MTYHRLEQIVFQGLHIATALLLGANGVLATGVNIAEGHKREIFNVKDGGKNTLMKVEYDCHIEQQLGRSNTKTFN